ncbi:MAG TPA: bifunctional diaminohydroxyphosphoribosylaminopyrimidine deaminase/5-amino-6-(5-phosphoribosylamino)uracil reductase RibD, partial [Elusimicrobiota bacterium]|nr:bifunctional diaminohydroxyphosphoribosylaminopyrimidine deaminase/5-amino-6-(5-phosphoribosylamino)uracil reductase RibD [Elusimicrobiota bacterium]
MIRALNLAERGRLNAHPNPLVGCVVARGPRVLAEGWHDRFGGDHAEVAALRRAGSRARGATLYVTLEPCSRWGKTPPCTDAVKAAGVRRVVIGARDPSLRGGGVAVLKRAGLRVDSGLHQREVLRQNAAFFKKVKTGLPYVVVKMAQTLDGKTASRAGASRWITGVRARSLGHRLRAQSDAVMVGGETVRRDNPGLTSHGRGPDPLRVVLSSSLQFSPRAAVFAQGAPTWVLTGDSSPAARKKSLERRGAVHCG